MQGLQLANATPGTLLSKETIEKLRNQIKNPNGDSGEQQINPQNNTDSVFFIAEKYRTSKHKSFENEGRILV